MSRVIAIVGPELSGRNTLLNKFIPPIQEHLNELPASNRNWVPYIDVTIPVQAREMATLSGAGSWAKSSVKQDTR